MMWIYCINGFLVCHRKQGKGHNDEDKRLKISFRATPVICTSMKLRDLQVKKQNIQNQSRGRYPNFVLSKDHTPKTLHPTIPIMLRCYLFLRPDKCLSNSTPPVFNAGFLNLIFHYCGKCTYLLSFGRTGVTMRQV